MIYSARPSPLTGTACANIMHTKDGRPFSFIGNLPKPAGDPGGVQPGICRNRTGVQNICSRLLVLRPTIYAPGRKIQISSGRMYNGGGNRLKEILPPRARDTRAGSRPGTAAGSSHTPAAPIPGNRERRGNGREGQTKRRAACTCKGTPAALILYRQQEV